MTAQSRSTDPRKQVTTYHRIMIGDKVVCRKSHPIHFTDTEAAITIAAYLFVTLGNPTIKVEYTYDDPLQKNLPNWQSSSIFKRYLSTRERNIFPDKPMFDVLDEHGIDWMAFPLCIGVQLAGHIHCRRR